MLLKAREVVVSCAEKSVGFHPRRARSAQPPRCALPNLTCLWFVWYSDSTILYPFKFARLCQFFLTAPCSPTRPARGLFRFLNRQIILLNPKARHSRGWSGLVGVAHGRAARGHEGAAHCKVGQDVFRTIWPGDKPPSYNSANQKHLK